MTSRQALPEGEESRVEPGSIRDQALFLSAVDTKAETLCPSEAHSVSVVRCLTGENGGINDPDKPRGAAA